MDEQDNICSELGNFTFIHWKGEKKSPANTPATSRAPGNPGRVPLASEPHPTPSLAASRLALFRFATSLPPALILAPLKLLMSKVAYPQLGKGWPARSPAPLAPPGCRRWAM